MIKRLLLAVLWTGFVSAAIVQPVVAQVANVRSSDPVFESGASSDQITAEVSDLATVAGGTLLIVTGGEDPTAGVVSSLSGFTQLCATGSNRFKVWGKDAGANESDVVVTFTGTTAVKVVFAITYEGGRTVSDLMENGNACFVSTTTSVNLAYPSADVTGASALLGIGLKRALQWTSVAPISGFTELEDASTGLGNDMSITAEYWLSPTDLTANAKTVTGDASQVNYYFMMPLLAAAEPEWSVEPAVTDVTQDAYYVDFTLDISGTMYGVACRVNLPAPDRDQLANGHCGDDSPAQAACAVAAAGGVPDECVLMLTGDHPLHDLYFIAL